MHDALSVYFNGEKYAGLLLAGVAVALLVAAVVIFRSGAEHRSFALTLGILALVQIALGVGLYLRTGPQVTRLVAQLGSDPNRFYTTETARMTRIQRTFVIVEYVEVIVIVATAIVAFTQKARPGLTGVALGLLISVACLLAFDVIAERRGAVYLAALNGSRPIG